jgi:hypothetical protein
MWRAVDQPGNVSDILAQRYRRGAAAVSQRPSEPVTGRILAPPDSDAYRVANPIPTLWSQRGVV